MKFFILLSLMFCAFGLCSACSPFYTWGYAPTIHPNATNAYIHAVMAREAGDYQLALMYYNEALRYTSSDNVRYERDETEKLAKQHD